jgi:outer membrane protein
VKAVLLPVLGVAVLAAAQSIAVIDSERIFDTLGDVADARELLETEIEEWQAHADSLQEEIDSIEDDLSRTLMMSPERRREREDLLDEKKLELETYVSSTFGPGGLLERRNEELVAPIVAAINEAVEEISTEEGFELVLDATAGTVVFAAPAVDITEAVLERLSTVGTN